MSGKKTETNEGKKPLSHGWIVQPSKTYPDRIYFYNTITKCSTWENPCEQSSDKSSSNSPGSKRLNSSRSRSSVREQKRQRINPCVKSYEKNFTENSDIEDYDEHQDEYFENVPMRPFNGADSPPSSPDFVSPNPSSSKTNLCNEKSQLWLQFASGPKNSTAKRSLALGDLDGPSTSNSETSEVGSLYKKDKRSQSLSVEKPSTPEVVKRHNEKKKRKKKRAQSIDEVQRQRARYRSVDRVSFKPRDKTPAQTRLLKIREANAELLKKCAVSEQNKDQTVRKDPENVPTCSNSNGSEFPVPGKAEVWNARSAENDSAEDFVEEMDWEPSTEELDVQNINVFRQMNDKAKEPSRDISLELSLDNSPTPPLAPNSWLLVLDTNIFVSCLNFVKELRDTNISGLGFPILYIPWRVLQELDHLKESKIGSARKAISYLNETFKSRHPRCFGQSFDAFSKMVGDEAFAPDDEILQTCLELQKLPYEKKLTLLTNDKNLESKAIVSGVEVYSKKEFQKKYLPSEPVRIAESTNGSTSADNSKQQIDKVLCSVKKTLKNFLSVMVETEMKAAFQKEWVKLAYKKPPWTLQDAFDCFKKHWRSVFFLIFTKNALYEAETLYKRLFNTEPATSQSVLEVINIAERFLNYIKKSESSSKSYTELLNVSLKELNEAAEELTAKQSPQAEEERSRDDVNPPQLSTFSVCSPGQSSQSGHDSISPDDIFHLKNMFKDVWDSLRAFCYTISDVVNSPQGNNNISIPEIRLKLGQILNEVGELIVALEKVLEIRADELKADHPFVVHLSNFLIKFYPAMPPETVHKLTFCLAVFFADFEGRTLVSKSLLDFREFSRELSVASEYFDRTFSSF